MATDVSSRPRVGSAIDTLIDHGIEIGTESVGVDPRGASHRFLKRSAGHEAARPYGPQLRHRRAAARNDDRAPCLDFTNDGGGLIAQLALSDDTIHAMAVAPVALGSIMLQARGWKFKAGCVCDRETIAVSRSSPARDSRARGAEPHPKSAHPRVRAPTAALPRRAICASRPWSTAIRPAVQGVRHEPGLRPRRRSRR